MLTLIAVITGISIYLVVKYLLMCFWAFGDYTPQGSENIKIYFLFALLSIAISGLGIYYLNAVAPL